MAEPQTWEEAAALQTKAFDAFTVAQDKNDQEVKTLGAALGDTKETLAKAMVDLETAQDAQTAILAELGSIKTLKDELETKLHRLDRTGVDSGTAQHTDAYAEVYDKYVRGGGDEAVNHKKWFKMAPLDWEVLQKGEQAMELKNIATDSGETGGYAMPAPQKGKFIEKLIQHSPIEELAMTETISIGDTYEVTAEGDQNFAAGWVSEREARAETQAGHLRKVLIPAHEMYANPFITQKALNDPAHDLAAWMTRRVAKRFAVISGTGYVSGTDEGQPAGLATNANRQAAAVVSGHATEFTADGIIDLMFDLDEFYAKTASFLLRRAALKDIMKLKASGTGEYLFSPATASTPATIWNQNYREAVDWPAVAANAYALGYGDWESAYLIVAKSDVLTLRNPYRNPPFVEFYTTMSRGGKVVLPEAYRLQKIST
ncbi:MAG: phage major capsid protein [bacterium]|nr:phage major capsid protein [bacterium]